MNEYDSTNGEHELERPVLAGKDEMNLAEFPVASLRRRGDTRDSFSYEGWITGKDGKRQRQKWVVRGLSGIGLPTEYDERVLVALMALTASHQLASREVPFSVYQLLQVMGLSDSKRDYDNIENSLRRLVGVTIFAEGAFWDNREQAWVKLKSGFHLIEKFWLAYLEEDEAVREEEGVLGYIVWSEDIWKSIQDGYIKNLDLAFYYSLQSPLARRLYRFLDKRMAFQSEYQIDVFDLAGRLGMTRYKYPSKVVEKLQPALDELIARRYLLCAEVVKVRKWTRLHFERPIEALSDSSHTRESVEPEEVGEEGSALPAMVTALLTEGLTLPIAEELASRFSSEHIQQKIDYLHWEQHINRRRIRNTVGWLRQAIEEDYAPPKGYERTRSLEAELVLFPPEEVLEGALEESAEEVLWREVLRDLGTQTTRATYESLYLPTQLLALDDTVAVIGVPNPRAREWLANRLYQQVVGTLERHLGHAIELSFVVMGEG